ncbi:unnamed protein product [Didymodactylos carnosus]|uniref:Uncharacterized protein n=1 Tax=Didymodactylos carnosus TaxID=1234261 RepID=A0A814HK71_9BILA|nr:unnamed protein product [Didymodactylos carnosus]CAF3783331.1 unnamed protein product [Didymodactylos carnosus]
MHSEDFCDKNGFNKACYPVQFWKSPQLNKEILICRIQNGFFFAEYDTSKRELRLLAQDSLFPDSSRWYDEHNQLQWGSFYGPDMPLGLFTRHIELGIRFYLLNPNGFKKNERPIWEDGNTNKHIQSIWRAKDDHFEFADITGTGITNIIRQNDEGLSIYGFQMTNEGFVLKELIKTDLCNKASGWRSERDKLWFVRLTKSQFSNLVLLQSDGLRVYQYVEEEKRFDCLNHDTSMAERFGWNKEHSDSLLFADISGSGLMQLIYTGPRGLTICSFNPDTRKWETNLNPDELNLKNNSSNNQETKLVKSTFVPPQGEFIVRPKSIAFLRDTLDIKPLLSAVNTYTGKLDFTLPFLNLGTGPNGLKIQLSLQYQGVHQHASILGVGWNLVEDYIAVDYQGNVDPLTHRYYWITSHGSMPLLCQNSQTAHIKNFRLAASYCLFLIKSLNVNNLPNIQENAVILAGPRENNDYYAYHVQNNQWVRNKEDNQLKKILIKNIDVNNFEPVEEYGLIKINDKNFKNIVKVIRIATSNENYFDMNITYYSDKQYWEMKTPEGEKRVYGNDTKHQKRYPVRWHLKEIQGYEAEKITYNYETVQRRLGNESFTQSMYLKSISDNCNNTIQFNYEKKSLEEYQEPILSDEDGNLQFSPTFGHYLKNIEIITRVNIQTIEFQYQLQNKIRHLVALSQLEDTCQEPILKFSYKDCDSSTQLDQIHLPSGEKVNFIYHINKLKHIGYSSDVYSGKHVLREQPQITVGPNYLILSEIYGKTLNFKKLQTNKTSFINLPSIQGICMYRAFAHQDYFGFIVKNDNNTFALFLYHRRSCGEWLLEPKQYSISVFKIQWIDNNLIIINPQQQLIIIHWNVEQQVWQEQILSRPSNVSQNSEIFFTTNQSLVIVYDDQHLWIGYKDFNKNWQIKLLRHIPNYFLKSKQTLVKFEITSGLSQKIYDYLKLQVLQSHNNIICLSSWQEENSKLKSIISIFMLDSNNNIRFEKTDTIIQEESYQEIFSKPQEQEFIQGDKITYRLMYEKSNGKFRVVFEPQQVAKEVEIEKIKHRRLYELNNQEIKVTLQGVKGFVIYNNQTGQWFTEMAQNLQNDSHSLTEHFKDILLVDLTKYLPQLNINQITWSNKKWLFDGYQWQEKIIEEDIVQGNKFVYKLGKDYILYKANKEASFKLYKQDAKGQLTGDYVFDFNVTSWENIYNGYPNYIAYKPSDNRIFILPIKKKTMTLDGTYYLADGNLTPWSNSQLLIISQSISQEKDSQTFTFYSNPGHCEPYQDPVIVKSSLEIVNEKRHTGYFYHEKSATIMNDIIVYHKTDTIPGDEKFGHGWIEDNYESDNVQRRYFNAKQEEISAPLKDRNSKDNNSKPESLPDPKTTLFINKTNLEIAQFYNASVLDDEAAYLGFESYEIDNALAWNYERQNLIKNDWTLTGEYYLRLRNKNDSIHRTFSPKNQDCSYQAACWIRSTNTNSALSVDFKAIIKTNKQDIIGLLPAKLLISRGEWCYFEINIDLAQIKTNGTLTLIYSRKVNNKLCFFQEDTIKVENQQNPGFSALGVLKSTAIEQLLANVHNVELRSLVAPEIQIGFLQDVLPEIMKNKSSYKNIHEKYQRHQEKVNQCVYQINKDIGLKDNQQLDFKNLLEHIKQQPKYKVYYQQLNELKVVSDQIKVELENYSKSEDTFKDFIRHVIDTHDYLTYLMNTKEERTITTSTFDAIAILNNICFYVWKANSNNELVLFRTNEEKIIKPQQTINLLYTATSAQFQKLIDVTNKCLPKEKRESLKQGHEYLLIDLIIQPTNDYSLDIDHIRFSPRDQQFYARVYNPQTYQVTSLLDGNGSIKYVFYNQQYEPLAVTDWNKYLNELSIHGRHGTALSFGSMLAREQPRSQMKIKPIHGFYEEFSKTSFEERWLIDTIKNWKRTPGCLIHTGKSGDSLILQNEWLDEYSAGLHVQLYVQSDAKIEIKLHKHSIIVECLNTNKTNLIINNKNISSVPSYGEYLIISEGNRLWLWINGQLQLDQAFKVHVDNSNYLSLHLTGNVSLNQLVLFSKPAIDVVYKTILDEELQTIQLENSQTAIVSQTLYDDLGRQAIIIKPTQIIVDDDKPLLAFQNDFIQNGYIHQNNNVWQTGKLIGTGNKFNPKDEGYCYSEVRYADNPLNEKSAIGQPGRLFTVNEIGCLKYTRDVQSDFINLLFPSQKGYSVQVCIQPHGTKQITVLCSRGNQVALYVYTNMGNNLLTTYEYDDENRVITVLPPTYHAHRDIDTLSQVIPYTQLTNQWKTNEQQRNLQNNFATRMTYNKDDQVIERRSPDTSKQILIYSHENLLRFILQHDINGKSCRVVYYQYDRRGDLSSQGYSTECLSQEDLQNLANNYSDLPQAIPYMQIIKNNSSINASLRSKSVTSVINQSEGIWRESSTYLEEGKLSTREMMTFSNNLWQIYRIDYTYFGEYISSITYPMLFKNQPLIIAYSRNKQNRITAIGTSNNVEQWIKFTYDAHGQISDETHIVNNFTTHYDYNSPGYLENTQNSYLKETIYYTEGSYGQGGYFDGTIARTQFKAQWFDHCDKRILSFSPETFRQRFETAETPITLKQAEYYLKALENAGFLDNNRRVIKAFLPREAALYLPRECGGIFAYKLAELLNECFTQDYGHQYSYGNHMELVKAKYIVGDKSLKPIQPSSFKEKSSKITPKDSESIWKILIDEIYIQSDNDDGIHLQGKVNTDKWIDYETFKKNLKQYADYDHLLATILQKYISQREILTFEKFQKIFFIWLQVDSDTQPKSIGIYTETAKNIWTILSNEGYLYSANKLCSLFKKEFYQILKNYQIFIPEIIGVLQEHSSCQMGESSCDVEAYRIDENGNHRHYWTGYSRYELQYKKTNNQIEHIDYKSMVRDKPKTSFKMIHDALGNVTKAEHKGIMEIIYDPTTNRPKIIKLQDGRQVSYDYDVQGERVRKHVINRKGEKLMEVLYLRDGEGRSLVEKVIDFTDSQHSEQYTGYIYGPKGLIGFIRNDEFYSVICDHEGSIRLIVKNQEIVAAYDYLPYGNLIRQYGIPQVQISYRYTGQEWDEETGLYNYHARLYDPDIGRFYQIDPQEQYASPYKYCGNSPISLIDPSGEIAFLPFLMIGLGVLGGYLGGSATNNSWLPWEWDLTKASTYLGIGGGALAGALAPIGITASTSALVAMGLTVAKATTITSLIGVAGMYLGMATGNHNWNMMQWQWSRPMTWSSGFQGFIFGASAIGGVGAWYQYYTSLGVVGKWALTISSGGLSISMGYLSCAAVNNSFSFKQWKLSLGTVFAGLGGAFGGFMVPLGFVYTGKFVSSFQTTNAQLLIGCGTIASGLGTAYLFGSAANNSFTNWNMSSPKTYESVMSGILFGISLPGLPKAFKEGMKNTSKAWKRIEFKNYFEKGKYGTDEQFAKEIVAAVDPLFDGNVQGLTKPSKAGAISITTTADGKKFFAYSGSEKNAVVYGVIDQKGNIHMHIEGIVPDLRDGKRFGFELIEKKLNITKQQVWDQSGMPNERGHTQPRAPETCREPRAMQLTFEAGYLKDDILSFSTFKRSSSGAVPINACPNCQQYVPGKIYTESIFYNSFQNSFGHVIFTAQFSIPQLHQNSSI